VDVATHASKLIGSVGYGFEVKTEPTALRNLTNQNDHWKPNLKWATAANFSIFHFIYVSSVAIPVSSFPQT
jgi:hypothetical protein